MAVVSDIEIRLMADVARLRQDMNAVRQSVDSNMNGISRSVQGVKNLLSGMFAGIGVAAFVSQVVTAQREMDKINAQLVTATGSTKGAAEAFGALQKFAASTPYGLQEVTEAFLKLRNLGLTPSERALRAYGNTASAMGKDLNQLIEAVADAATGEFERLKEFGIKSKKEGDSVAFTFQGTTTKVKNSADDIEKYLMQIGEVNFAGGMERQANTLDGALSALGDTWKSTLVAFSDSGFGDAVYASVLALSGALTDLQAMFKAVGREVRAEGEAVKEVGILHQGLTTFFEALMVLGTNVSYVFKTIGKDIGAFAAQAGILFTGGFAGLVDGSTLRMVRDIGQARTAEAQQERREVDATSERILKAAGEAAKARAEDAKSTEDRTAKYKIEAKTVEGLTDTQKKAAEAAKKNEAQRLSGYQSLITAAQQAVFESGREAQGLAELTKSQEMAKKLDDDLSAGKVKLTAREEAYYRALIDTIGANEETIKANEKAKVSADNVRKAVEALDDSRRQTIDSARTEAESAEQLVSTFGMTAQAIEQVTIARLEDRLSRRVDLELDEKEIAYLTELIELKKRSAGAAGDLAELQKTRDMWESIEKTAHDTFVSIMDGGKDAATRLKDTFKNIFFDWLYQQTLKKWIINLSGTASLSTAAGAASAAGGATGGLSGSVASIGGIAGLIGSAGAIGVGGLQTAGALLAGHIGLGSTISAGVSALATGTAAGVSAGLASLAGTLGPIALGVFGAVKLLDKAFGRGPKTTTGQGITGTFGADSFSGQNFTEWMKKGGWFSSTKRGTDTSALSAEMSSTLNAAYATIKDSTGAFAAALGVPADVVASYSKTIKLAFTGDAAKDQQALTDLFTQMGDELAGRVLPNVAQFIKEGETAASALQRLATEFTVIDTWLQSLGLTSSQAFGAVGTASLEARDRLITLAGGLESFVSQVDFFNANFLTDAERMAPVQKQLAEQMAALGYASIDTNEEFKTLVQGLASSGELATESGAKTYAALLALAPAFKQVTDYTKQLTAAQEDAAEQMAATLAQGLRDAAGSAFDTLHRSINARRASVQDAFSKVMADLEDRIGVTGNKINSLTGLASLLAGTRTGMAGMGRSEGQAQIQAALAIAKASGVLPSADSLRDAISAVSQDAQDQFSSFVDYQRDALLTQNAIEELAGITDTELSVAQRTLDVLNAQKLNEQAAFDREIARLDEMVSKAQMQIDAINGVNNSVLSMVAAFGQFASTISSALSNPTIGGQASVGPVNQIESLYNSLLGRNSDASGMKFYQDQLAAGLSLDYIRQEFMNSPEYKAMQSSAVYSGQQSSRMMTSGAGQQQINAEMQAALNRTASAVEQMANQIDQVTGGGNAMLTETV